MAPALTASTAVMAARRQLPTAAQSSMLAMRMLAMQQRGYATPMGPPPKNFRTSKRVEFAWEKDNTLDKMGKYFLLTEMARGMYVLMEQFFRPPYTIYYPFEKVRCPGFAGTGVRSSRDTDGGSGPDLSPVPRRARPATIPLGRRALHRLQAL